MKQKKKIEDNPFLSAIKREKTRNYVILYAVILVIWLVLFIISLVNGFFTKDEFVVNLLYNISGILPPILIFDFFNEKLSSDAKAAEMSNKITETLMSTPETMSLFTYEQRKNFIKSTIASIVDDDDVTEMINGNLQKYLFREKDFRIRTEFDYDFELNSTLPMVYDSVLKNPKNYFHVQQKLHYKVRYLSNESNNVTSNMIKIVFMFDNTGLDSVLRESKTVDLFNNCIFREILDITPEDAENIKNIAKDKEMFIKLFKPNVQIDRFNGVLENVEVYDNGIVCWFNIDHDCNVEEHSIRIIFQMPKKWGSILEVALVDPTKAPSISLSYPEESMEVDMYSFLNKGVETSIEGSHENLNGIYEISIRDEWIYPVSGITFNVNRKEEFFNKING